MRSPLSYCLLRALLMALLIGRVYRVDAFALDIHVKGGSAPKLHRELVLMPLPATPEREYDVKVVVRDTRKNVEVASEMLAAFSQPDEDDNFLGAAWSPTGEFVAFNLQCTRHTRQTLIYQIRGSRMKLIDLPDCWPQAQRVLGSEADFRGGTETPLRWLDDHTVLVSSFGNLRNDDKEFDLLLTVTLKGGTASIRSVKLQSLK